MDMISAISIYAGGVLTLLMAGKYCAIDVGLYKEHIQAIVQT